MHLVFATRGIYRQVEELKALLNAQRFAWKRKNLKTGKEELMNVQGALRPIQLWEYVFPEESLNDVLGAMRIKGPITRPEIKNMSWMLRKLLKLKKVPDMPEDATVTGYIPQGKLNDKTMPAIAVHDMWVDGVGVYPIGIKDDVTQDYDWGYNQEGL